jgi:hypothetical protein
MGGIGVLILVFHWGRLGGKTHLLAIPALAAPAHALGIDDASAGATAPWIV